MMDLFLLQLLACFGCFTILVLSGAVPFCLIRYRLSKRYASTPASRKMESDAHVHSGVENSLFLSLCNCFACGVFIATCFLGLIPHVRQHVTTLRRMMSVNSHNSTDTSSGRIFSFLNEKETEFLTLLGFFLTLLLEQVLTYCHKYWAGPTTKREYGSSTSQWKNETFEYEPLVVVNNGPSICIEDQNEHRNHILAHENEHEHEHAHCAHHELSLDVVRSVTSRDGKGLSFRALVLLIGMGIHSIFEGLALGLQDSQKQFVNLLIGVLAHEILCVVAFALTLAQQFAPLGSGFLSISVMSFTIPAGMVSGFLVPKEPTVGALGTRVMLEGLAAGTFVYVACVEILGAEMAEVISRGGGVHAARGVMKAVAVVVGFVMFLLVLLFSN